MEKGRGNGNKNQRPNHIISAVDEEAFARTENRVEEKTNEIKAIPELLDHLNIKRDSITTDTIGTQVLLLPKIHKKRADYVLALKAETRGVFWKM